MEDRNKFLVIPFKVRSLQTASQVLKGFMILVMLFSIQVIGINVHAAEMQQASVAGTITDQVGNPVAGVTVTLKGTTTGTLTDVAGKYSLPNVPQNGTLVFSFIGMRTQEIPVSGRGTIDVVMVEEAIGLEEVVVVGYGTQKKVNLTGSVASASGDELLNRPVSSSSAMLEGLMTGVQVVQGRGEPGNENTLITIRGRGTFSNAGSNPLILIDGVQGNLENLNPNDIESVSVLKDAASASIYGARAANGVILVTTKMGTEGRMNIDYNGSYAIYTWTKMLDLVTNSVEYMELWNEAKLNTGIPTGLYTQDIIDAYKNATDRVQYPNTDWLSLVFEPAPTQTHNLSFNGGSSTTKYNVSLGYLDQKGIMKGFNYKRYNFRLNLSSQINKAVTFGGNMGMTYGYRTGARQGSEDQFIATMAQAPTYGPYLPDGSGRYTFKAYSFEYNNKNPIVIEKEQAWSWLRSYAFTSQGWVDVKIFKGLNWYTKGAFNLDFSDNRVFRPQVPLYNFRTYEYMTLCDVGGAGMNATDNLGSYLNLYSYLNYDLSFGNGHSFKAQAGYNVESSTNRSLTGYRQKYPSDVLKEIDAGTAEIQTAGGNTNQWAIMSFFGRLNYNYKDRYLFEANLRYDGTSRLSPQGRWGAFPSFSAAWRPTQEPFFQDFGLGWLNNLKIRASYGTLGNQNIGNYPYQAMLSFTGAYPFDDSALSPGVAQTALNNLNIKWETTTITDVGFDLTVLKGLSLTFDWYNKITTDILRSTQVTGVVGLSAPTVNNGTLKNSGYEVSLSYSNAVKSGILNGLVYNAGVNFDHYKNKLVEFGAEEKSTRTIRKEGLEYDAFYMLEWIGIFQTADEVATSPKQYNDNTVPGDLKWKDQITVDSNADGILDATDGVINDNDRIPMKGQYPSLNYSFNGSASWKGLDFSFLFQGVSGDKFFVTEWGVIPFNQGAPPTTYWRDRWTPENPSETVPRIYWGRPPPTKIDRPSSYYLQDASYLRLKNLALGYVIPSKLTKRIGIERLRVYFSGDNLLTFTQYPGLDPERSGSSTRFVQYPQNKIYAFGVNVKF
ncbi:MAG: TonB-dependent receptor [Bacteroidales bacterium]|nr:TonB-dependent receptor [Bacteroidales bacterium]